MTEVTKEKHIKLMIRVLLVVAMYALVYGTLLPLFIEKNINILINFDYFDTSSVINLIKTFMILIVIFKGAYEGLRFITSFKVPSLRQNPKERLLRFYMKTREYLRILSSMILGASIFVLFIFMANNNMTNAILFIYITTVIISCIYRVLGLIENYYRDLINMEFCSIGQLRNRNFDIEYEVDLDNDDTDNTH